MWGDKMFAQIAQRCPSLSLGKLGNVDCEGFFRSPIAVAQFAQRFFENRVGQWSKTGLKSTLPNCPDCPPSTRGCRRRAKLRPALRGASRRACSDDMPRRVITNDERTTRRLSLTGDTDPSGHTATVQTVTSTRARRDAPFSPATTTHPRARATRPSPAHAIRANDSLESACAFLRPARYPPSRRPTKRISGHARLTARM